MSGSKETPTTSSIITNNTITSNVELKKAVYLLQQGCGYRSYHIDLFDATQSPSSIKAYRFKSSAWYRIYGFFICIIQLTLCFVEPNSLLLKSKTESIVPLNICLIIELYCQLMHFIALYIAYKGVGIIRKQRKVSWYCCGISTISILLMFIYPCSLFRIYRFLRPFAV